MSKKRPRRGLRPLLRLRPFLGPYRGWLALIVVATLVFAVADACRAQLVKPLLNDVLAGSGSGKDQASDALFSTSASSAAHTAADAVKPQPLAQGEVDALRLDPALGGVADVSGIRDEDLADLLQRSGEHLIHTADGIPLEDEEPGWTILGLTIPREARDYSDAWTSLGEAIALQQEARRRALSLAESERELAGLLSLRARSRAMDATFQVVFDTLVFIVLAALAIGVTMGVTGFSRNYLNRYLQQRIFRDVQNQLTAHLLTLPLSFFEGEQRRGDVFSRLTNDLQLFANLLLVLFTMFTRVLHLAILLGWAISVSGLLCLSLGVLVLPLIVTLRRFGKRIRRGARRTQQEVGNSFEAMQQMFSGIREVKACQREEHETQRFKGIADAALDASIKVVNARAASKSFQQGMNDLAAPLLFLAGGYFVVTKQWDLTVGDFGAFLGLVVLMYQPAKVIGDSYNQLMHSIPSLERVMELFDQKPLVLENEGAAPLEELREGIQLEDVSFSYDEDRVLEGISLSAPRGSMTAFVGKTGSGKSTLVDLIARFHSPSDGRILLDGTDLRDLSLKDYLQLVALVPQESFLFNGTIRENIRYGRLDATDEEVEAAAKAARIHEEIVAFAEGYETLAGERGSRLSGGQIQRIAIARAVLKRPRILLLDEATSALDTKTERLVQQALDELSQGATTFVIAHRLSTVQQADQILVLEGGRLLEAGRHDELLARGGTYAKLVERQLEGHGGPEETKE